MPHKYGLCKAASCISERTFCGFFSLVEHVLERKCEDGPLRIWWLVSWQQFLIYMAQDAELSINMPKAHAPKPEAPHDRLAL